MKRERVYCAYPDCTNKLEPVREIGHSRYCAAARHGWPRFDDETKTKEINHVEQ